MISAAETALLAIARITSRTNLNQTVSNLVHFGKFHFLSNANFVLYSD